MLPLFYQNPAPLDSEKHRHLSLRNNFGFDYAKNVNAVPVNIIEFSTLCHVYPIAFSPDRYATPVAIVGLRSNENLFVDAEGQWDQVYIPAYVRRYPFIFSEISNTDQLTLSIDLTPDVIVEDNSQPFFDTDGNPSELSNNALEFCKSYHSAANQTFEFSKLLIELDLLVEREAVTGQLIDGTKISFSGFSIIDEKKFIKLHPVIFDDLRKKGFLPYIYAHLFSRSNWNSLINRLNQFLSSSSNNFNQSKFIPPTETVLSTFERIHQNNRVDLK